MEAMTFLCNLRDSRLLLVNAHAAYDMYLVYKKQIWLDIKIQKSENNHDQGLKDLLNTRIISRIYFKIRIYTSVSWLIWRMKIH
jgi:hypothetical protein